MKNLKCVNCSKYSIDRFGNIYSSYSKRFLKLSIGMDNYYKVTLVNDDGKPSYLRVSRLVGIAYIPNPENKPVINHIDGDKLNNFVGNLEWSTVAENTQHSYNTGLQTINNGHEVTDFRVVHEICKLLEQGVRPKEISEIVGIKKRKVDEIRTKEYWSSISDEYNFDSVTRENRLQLSKVKLVCELLASGKSVSEIEKLAKVGNTSVYRIKNRKAYTDISSPYVW